MPRDQLTEVPSPDNRFSVLVDRPHFAADYFGPATMLSLHSRLSITDAEFMCVLPAFVDATKRCARVHSLVFSDGGAPSLSQRRRLFDALGDHRRVVRNAVVTDAPSVRFVIGAMSLVVETIQVFAPDQVAEAMNYLGYSIRERRDALDQLALVAKKIPVGRFFAFDRAAERLALPR